MFDVWPENWDTVQLFLACRTQWRIAAMGGVIGLDYTGVDVVIKRLGLDVTPDMFAGLQTMERAAAAELNRDRS